VIVATRRKTDSLLFLRRIAPIATCVCTFFVSLASAAEIPVEYRATVARSAMIANLLTVHQISANRAHDELKRRGILKTEQRLRGWVSDFTLQTASVLVTFVGDVDGVPHALYRVVVPAEGKITIEALAPAQPLDESERARFAARNLAIAEFAKRGKHCAERYDTVVLPVTTRADPFMYVYQLAANDKPRVARVGGEVRYEVSANGAHIDDQRTFGEGCLELAIPKRWGRAKAEAIKLTQMSDLTPTEWHLFVNRTSFQALDVETPESGMVWAVRERKIEFVGPMK